MLLHPGYHSSIVHWQILEAYLRPTLLADPIPGNDSDELDWIWVGNRLNQLVDDAVHWVFYEVLRVHYLVRPIAELRSIRPNPLQPWSVVIYNIIYEVHCVSISTKGLWWWSPVAQRQVCVAWHGVACLSIQWTISIKMKDEDISMPMYGVRR